MKLKMQPRSTVKKGELNGLRREGNIPAVIYVQGKAAESITVGNNEFTAALRQVIPGRLPTTVFTLTDHKGKQRRAIIKEIQYHPTTYNVMHLDFEELHNNIKINVKVPIECVGTNECVGVKLGGAVRQVIRYLLVRCLPEYMPQAFEFDVRELGPRQSRRLSELAIPAHVTPLANMDEVAVVIVKR